MSHSPRIRKTKIVATIGPACDDVDTLKEMIRAGMNVARINLSHGTYEEQSAKVGRIRDAARAVNTSVAVMVDTRGVEIRTATRVDEIIVEQLASSYAVLTEDDKELGVCLVDIGAGTTDIAVFVEGSIRHTAVIPIAGDQVTNDIAVALRTPTQHAEEIKIKYGCALRQLAGEEETIEVPGVGERPPRTLSRQVLASVLEPRYEELFELIKAELQNAGFLEMLGSGIVLTGGSSKMNGVEELAEEVFHMPVRIESPKHVKGLSEVVRNPIYSTGVGLLLYGLKSRDRGGPGTKGETNLWVQLKKWLGSF